MTTTMDPANDCKEPGVLAPAIDRNRCEAKGDCVAVCPYDVFEVRPIDSDDWGRMSWMGRLKAVAHGRQQAYAVRPDACHSCGRCVTNCPEDAIKLRRVP